MGLGLAFALIVISLIAVDFLVAAYILAASDDAYQELVGGDHAK